MKYRLTVEQFEPNPDYMSQLAAFNRREQWGEAAPQVERTIKTLVVELTDVEWQAVKKAAIATMA